MVGGGSRGVEVIRGEKGGVRNVFWAGETWGEEGRPFRVPSEEVCKGPYLLMGVALGKGREGLVAVVFKSELQV